MDIVQAYLNINNNLTIAKEEEKIKVGYQKLLQLPLKPTPPIVDIQKERCEKYFQPLLDDIDDFHVELTQQLVSFKEKQTTLRQSDVVEELNDWKRLVYFNIEKAGDELIESISRMNEEFQTVKGAIDAKAKELFIKPKRIGAIEKKTRFLPKKLKIKTNRVEGKVKAGLEKITIIRSLLVHEPLKLDTDETKKKQFNLRRVVRRIIRLNWVKAKIQAYDRELELIHKKKLMRKRAAEAKPQRKRTKVIKKKIKKRGKAKKRMKQPDCIKMKLNTREDKMEKHVKDKEDKIGVNEHLNNLWVSHKQNELSSELRKKYERIMNQCKEQERSNKESNKKWYEEISEVLKAKSSLNQPKKKKSKGKS